MVLSVIGFCAYQIFFNLTHTEDHGEQLQLRSEIVKVKKGYGYHIWAGDKLLVKQEFIPAINGAIPFQSYGDAERTAALVESKLKNRANPEISVEELGKLNIITLKP